MIPAPLLEGKGRQKEEYFNNLIGSVLNDPAFYDDDAIANITRELYGEF